MNDRIEAAETIPGLIERIELTPIEGSKRLSISLHGDLARILQSCEAGERASKRPGTVFRGVGYRWWLATPTICSCSPRV